MTQSSTPRPARLGLEKTLFAYLTDESITRLYYSTELDHVTCAGKVYYNNSTGWASPHHQNPHDKYCGAYMDKCTHRAVAAQAPIEYHVRSLDFSDLDVNIFPVDLRVTLHNGCGINDDHRGSDHTDIYLDFNSTWVLTGPTLRDLVEGLYRVKSHKFDRNYEMFIEATLKCLGQDGQRELHVHLVFDHGS